MEVINNFLQETGFALLFDDPRVFIMMLIAFVLMYLAIKKGFEPLRFPSENLRLIAFHEFSFSKSLSPIKRLWQAPHRSSG